MAPSTTGDRASMIRSMTGYGDAERDTPIGRLRLEVKTVNHRFFNAHLRTPPGFDRHEAELQTSLKKFFSRGHVNLTLVLERTRSSGPEGLPELDLERARHYRDLLDTLREELDLSGEVELPSILRFGDPFQVPEAPLSGPTTAMLVTLDCSWVPSITAPLTS